MKNFTVQIERSVECAMKLADLPRQDGRVRRRMSADGRLRAQNRLWEKAGRCSRRLLFHRIVTAHVVTNGTSRAARAYSCSAYIALDAGGFALGNGKRNIDCTVLRSRLRATAWICETRDSSTPS